MDNDVLTLIAPVSPGGVAAESPLEVNRLLEMIPAPSPMQPTQYQCSLIIPAHNEERRLADTLRRYHRALAEQYGNDFEIIVIANGCSDATAAVAASLSGELPQIRVTDIPEAIGKGGAVLAGLQRAAGERVLFADADGATDPASIISIANGLASHDVVIGSRSLPTSRVIVPQSLRRRVLGRWFRFAVRHLLHLDFHDTQCGAKGFRKASLPGVINGIDERGWAFDVDLLLNAQHMGLDIMEVPVVWADSGASTLKVWQTMGEVGGALIRLKQRELHESARPAAGRLQILAPEDQPGADGVDAYRAPGTPLRILALNWRCFRHPQAGGAEVNIFEQAQRWARAGQQVTVFTADPGRQYAPERNEWFNGVHVVRAGGQFTVYIHAGLYMALHHRSFDRVVDVENGIPFFAPLFTRKQGVLLVHHVHDDQWRVEFPGIVGRVGRFLETRVMPLVYRSWPIIAVSPTTREALEKIGFKPSTITVVFNGVRMPSLRTDQEPKPYHVAYVGRLKRYKRLDRLVDAAAELGAEFPDLQLDIAGDGDARQDIQARVDQLHLQDRVHLYGFVDEATKSDILASAEVFATPSMQEGWGLSVIEANAYGCPAVAYDVPGLKVAIRDGETGLLAKDPEEFCRDIALLLRDPELRERCSRAARAWAETFDWNTSAARTLKLIAGSDVLPAEQTPLQALAVPSDRGSWPVSGDSQGAVPGRISPGEVGRSRSRREVDYGAA